MGATEGRRGRRVNRRHSLPRTTVLVLTGILLTVVQTFMSLTGTAVWQQAVAAVSVAALAVFAELDRHFQEQDEADAQPGGGLSPMALAADRLAVVVRETWAAEAKRRGVTTPAPASVRWRWAAPEVAVPRDEVVAPAGALGPGVVPAVGSATDGPVTVLESGVVTRLHDELYARLPRGRLVILGEAGAGKTGAMLLLLLQALQHREGFEPPSRMKIPVPVWLTLGGWDPGEETLREWALAVIDRDHPYLRNPAFGSDAPAALLDSGCLALFLDGFDEMPAGTRSEALRRLDVETANVRLVLTSRPEEYRQALGEGRLHSAAVIEVRPVRPAVAATFLVRGEVGERRDEWAAVGDFLREHPESVAAQALNTPLTLSLARFAYQQGQPAELVAPGKFATPLALREHLVGGVLRAAYPNSKQRARAFRWLSWAAYRMGEGRDLAWWEVTRWTPRWRVLPVMAVVAVMVSVVATIVGQIVLGALFDTQTFAMPAGRDTTFVTDDPLAGRQYINEFVLPLAVAVGLAAWWVSLRAGAFALRNGRPVRLEPRLPRTDEYLALLRTVAQSALGLGLLVGLLVGVIPLAVEAWDRAVTDGLAAQVVDRATLEDALRVVLAAGLGIGVAAGLVIGLIRMWSLPRDGAVALTPRSSYSGDRRARLAVSLLAGGAVALSVGALVGGVYGPTSGLAYGVMAGAVVAVVGRVVFGLSTTLRYAEYVERAPRLLTLFEDALDRQVLRQAGSVYQFRHAELQDHLATEYEGRVGVAAAPPGRSRSFVAARRARLAAMGARLLRSRWRRPLLIAAGVVGVVAVVAVLVPAVDAMLRPDHVTLTDTEFAALAFSPDGAVLATSGNGRTVLWDIEGRKILQELSGELVGSSTIASSVNPGSAGLAFSENGKIVATADGPILHWWEVATGEEIPGSGGSVGPGQLVISFSPDRKLLASLESATGRVFVWNLLSEADPVEIEAWSAEDTRRGFLTLGFSPAGDRVVTAGGDDERDAAQVWDVSDGHRVARLSDDGDSGRAAFSPDGELLVVGSVDEGVTVHHASGLGVVRQLDYLGGGLRFAPEGDLLALGFLGEGLPGTSFNTGGRQQVWRPAEGELVGTFESQPAKLLSDYATFSQDGTFLATVWINTFDYDSTTLLLCDVSSGASRELGRGNRELRSMAFDPEGRLLATGWRDGRVRIWDVTAQE